MMKQADEIMHAYFKKIGAKGGKRGGKTTAARRTAAERSEAARKAVQARWAKARKKAVPPAAD